MSLNKDCAGLSPGSAIGRPSGLLKSPGWFPPGRAGFVATRNQSVLHSPEHGRGPVGDPGLAVAGTDVGLDGVRAEVQLRRNVLVACAARYPAQDVELARCEPVRQRACRIAAPLVVVGVEVSDRRMGQRSALPDARVMSGTDLSLSGVALPAPYTSPTTGARTAARCLSSSLMLSWSPAPRSKIATSKPPERPSRDTVFTTMARSPSSPMRATKPARTMWLRLTMATRTEGSGTRTVKQAGWVPYALSLSGSLRQPGTDQWIGLSMEGLT